MNCSKNKGDIGELTARKYLTIVKNMKILANNYHSRYGEIDIISCTDKYIVFVEVKTRRSLCYGRPAEAVTNTKQKHIEKVAKYYIYKNHLENEYVRFDIIEIYIYKDKYTIKHIKQVR